MASQSITVYPPAIERIAVNRPSPGSDNATKTIWLQYALYLLGGFQKELGVLKCLAGDKHIDAVEFELAPVIRVLDD
jgi:hypothetical protein